MRRIKFRIGVGRLYMGGWIGGWAGWWWVESGSLFNSYCGLPKSQYQLMALLKHTTKPTRKWPSTPTRVLCSYRIKFMSNTQGRLTPSVNKIYGVGTSLLKRWLQINGKTSITIRKHDATWFWMRYAFHGCSLISITGCWLIKETFNISWFSHTNISPYVGASAAAFQTIVDDDDTMTTRKTWGASMQFRNRVPLVQPQQSHKREFQKGLSYFIIVSPFHGRQNGTHCWQPCRTHGTWAQLAPHRTTILCEEAF